MTARTQRGRKVAPKPTNSLVPLFLLIGVVAIIGLVLLVVSFNQPAAVAPTSSGNATVDIASLGSFPSKGDATAPVTVVEYADYQCPGCAAYANGISAQIDKDYIDTGKVHFIYHELPIPGHQNAIVAAEAARAAGDQGKYWEMHDLLFARQNDWAGLPNPQALAAFAGYAKELGLNAETFAQTLSSGKYSDTIKLAYDASGKAGIQSTPSFVINGKIYTTNTLKAALDAALAAK